MERWNLNTTWVQIESVCVFSFGAPGYVIAIPAV